MQPLSRSKYRNYKLEALRRGDVVYEREDAASIFKAAFYEADKASQKYTVTRAVSAVLVTGGIIVTSAIALNGLFF